MDNTVATLSTLGSNVLHLRMELGTVIDASQSTSVPGFVSEIPDHGWIWNEGGWAGRVHGPNNAYWTPIDTYLPAPFETIFDPSNADFRIAQADDAGDWTIEINGVEVGIDQLSRKSNILDTAETGFFTFDFKMAEHVFFEIDQPLQTGDEVSIQFDTAGFEAIVEVVDPVNTISEAIHVNLKGFDPDDLHKVAYLSSWNGWVPIDELDGDGKQVPFDFDENTTFNVVNEATGSVVNSGTIELSKAKEDPTIFWQNLSGTDVWKMDFSDLMEVGTYHVQIDGIGRSQSFEIGEDHWGEIFDVSFSGFYHQRSGIALEQPYTDWERPRSLHPDDGIVINQSTVKLSDTSEGGGTVPFSDLLPGSETGEVLEDAWGGWHDAGDWDRRIQHVEAARKLIELAEIAPDFAENRIASIPEQGDGIPDLVDEALWTMEFYQRLQKDDGGVPGGIESASYAGYGEGSWSPTETLYAYAPDIWSTWEYAAGAAKVANILKVYAPDEVAGWTASALAAMDWADARIPDDFATDATLVTSRNLAAAELYRLTDDTEWHDVFLETSVYKDRDPDTIQWFEHQLEAGFVYARTGLPEVDAAVQANFQTDIEGEAFVTSLDGSGSGFEFLVNPYSPYGWGNTGQQPNYSADIHVRLHALTGDDAWLKPIQADLQYTLGANPMNMAFMTGLGVREPEEILLADADALGKGPPPGITIYGDYNIYDYGWEFYHEIMYNHVWPNYYQVPVAESFNGFSVFVPSAEYTVQQGITDMTFVTGYLAALQGDVALDGVFDFNATPFNSYGSRFGAQDAGTATPSTDGTSVTLADNAWKSIALDQVLTANTILQFDFSAPVLAEIHGIGFDSDDREFATNIFNLTGSQSWGRNTFTDDYTGGTVSYSIRLGDHYSNAQIASFDRMVFVMDDDRGTGGQSVFSNVTLTEDVDALTTFMGQELGSFSRSQDKGIAEISNGGTSVTLSGNAWKTLEITEALSADSVLQFEFESATLGEIHGIALETDDLATRSNSFRLLGTQNWGDRSYLGEYEVGDPAESYSIRLGDHFTGAEISTFTKVVLIMDDDAGLGGVSTFSNLEFV